MDLAESAVPQDSHLRQWIWVPFKAAEMQNWQLWPRWHNLPEKFSCTHFIKMETSALKLLPFISPHSNLVHLTVLKWTMFISERCSFQWSSCKRMWWLVPHVNLCVCRGGQGCYLDFLPQALALVSGYILQMWKIQTNRDNSDKGMWRADDKQQ